MLYSSNLVKKTSGIIDLVRTQNYPKTHACEYHGVRIKYQVEDAFIKKNVGGFNTCLQVPPIILNCKKT